MKQDPMLKICMKRIDLKQLKGKDQCCTHTGVCLTNILKILNFSYLPQAMSVRGRLEAGL